MDGYIDTEFFNAGVGAVGTYNTTPPYAMGDVRCLMTLDISPCGRVQDPRSGYDISPVEQGVPKEIKNKLVGITPPCALGGASAKTFYQFATPIRALGDKSVTITQTVPFIGKYRMRIIHFDYINGLQSPILMTSPSFSGASLSRFVLFNTQSESANYGNHFVIDNVFMNGTIELTFSRLDNGSMASSVGNGLILSCEMEKL